MVTCPSCGATNPQQASFCNSCGARLEAAPPPREERKLVSILFVDLVGFTASADRADPEDVKEALQLYHAEAKRRIEQYGDDAERAVRAGLAVLAGINDLNREHELDLAARAAVNTGEAVVSLDSSRG